ncbi:MAG: hypothetical protein WBP58_18155 [Chitinophagaceae bacterium]
MKQYLIILTFLLSKDALSQSQTYKVQPGEVIMQSLPAGVGYLYPSFKPGQVQFKNGNLGGAMMNYSPLLEEMDFINEKMDTMALNDIESMKYIVIEKDTFYRVQKFFVQQIANNREIRLCERRTVALANREKLGGHGELQNGSSIGAIEQLSNSQNPLRQMVAQQVMTFSLDKTYYFGDKYGNLRLANRKNLLDVFGNQYPGLNDFLTVNKINYMKADDMKLVLEFLSIDEQKKK